MRKIYWDIKTPHFCSAFLCGGGEAHSSPWFLFSLPCSADLSPKDLFSSSHIWLLCVTLVMTLLEGQRWPLSLSPQRPIQTHRLWTVSSASNHQRFMHPEGIKEPLMDRESLVFTNKKKSNSDEKVIKKMCYCFCFYFVLFFVFLRDLFCRKRPSTQDSEELHEHRDGWAAWTDMKGGQFVKHKHNFLKLRNHRRRAVERKCCWLFGEEITFPHMASDLSLCILLFSHRASIITPVFTVLSVPVAHPGISLPAGCCAGGKRGCFLLFFFSFAPSLCSRRRVYSVTLCSRAWVACRRYGGGADEAWG